MLGRLVRFCNGRSGLSVHTPIVATGSNPLCVGVNWSKGTAENPCKWTPYRYHGPVGPCTEGVATTAGPSICENGGVALRETLTEFFGQKAIRPEDYTGSSPVLHNNHPGQRLTSRGARAHLSAYGGSDAIDWVMDCVSLIADTASNAEYHFERKGKTLIPEITPQDQGDDTVEEAPQDLVKLLEQPNPWMDYTEMLELSIIDFLLTGNSYWLKFKVEDSGKPAALYRMAPPLITVVPGETRPIDHYEYLPPGSAKPLVYQPHEVLHIRRPNPHSQHFGVGVIACGPQMFDAELALTSSFGGYFQRGTRLSGVIESERSIPDKLWRKIVREFRQMFSRNENAWDVAALERGLKYRPLSATAAQAEYGNLIPLSRDRICAAFRVPAILLGFIGSAATSPVKEAQRIFDNKTMRPFLNKLQLAITHGLTQAWGVEFKIDYEYVMPIEDQFEMAKDFATLPGVKIREVRERVGLKPLGDDRDDIVLNLPGENDNASTVKDRSIGSEAGRPPNPENTRAIPKPNAPMPKDAAVQVAGPEPSA